MTSRTVAHGVIAQVLRRPHLWPTAVTVGLRMAAPGWWRRWPPGRWPDPAYLLFRMQTMYGANGEGPLEAGDVIGYLEWCRRTPGLSR